MTFYERITEACANDWDYEVFATVDGEICLQVWPYGMEMYEYVYNQDGKKIDYNLITVY